MNFSSLTGPGLFQNSRTPFKHQSRTLGSDFNLIKKTGAILQGCSQALCLESKNKPLY